VKGFLKEVTATCSMVGQGRASQAKIAHYQMRKNFNCFIFQDFLQLLTVFILCKYFFSSTKLLLIASSIVAINSYLQALLKQIKSATF